MQEIKIGVWDSYESCIDQNLNGVLTVNQDFKIKDIMKEENTLYSMTSRIAYTFIVLIILICSSKNGTLYSNF